MMVVNHREIVDIPAKTNDVLILALGLIKIIIIIVRYSRILFLGKDN
jgi:hypothetical protein